MRAGMARPRAGCQADRGLEIDSATMADDLARWREEFPILERTVYMISNSLAAMPPGTAASLAEDADTSTTRDVHACEERSSELGREVGDKVRRIIGAPAGSVSMHENVTTTAMA